MVEAIATGGAQDVEYEVIPGISAVQALAAKHKTSLNRIGESVEITTGRKLAEGFPDGADSVVVMLDTSGLQTRISTSSGVPMSVRRTKS